MGRRSLRRTTSAAEIEPWLRTLEQLPAPWRTEAVFGRDGPLEVEVGSGKGLFLSSASAARPDVNFLGIEVARKYALSAAGRLAKRGLSHARVVHADALRLFRELLPDGVLAAVHVYFPDPWWKARHKKRRVLNAPFLKDVERTLRPGGEFHFWTDVEEYFQSTLALVRETTNLVGPLAVLETMAAHDLDYRTHFERRMRLSGLPVHRALYHRASDGRVLDGRADNT